MDKSQYCCVIPRCGGRCTTLSNGLCPTYASFRIRRYRPMFPQRLWPLSRQTGYRPITPLAEQKKQAVTRAETMRVTAKPPDRRRDVRRISGDSETSYDSGLSMVRPERALGYGSCDALERPLECRSGYRFVPGMRCPGSGFFHGAGCTGLRTCYGR